MTNACSALRASEPTVAATLPKCREAHHFSMTTVLSECPDSYPPDHSVALDVFLRQVPEDEEDEEEDDGKEKEEDDDDDTTDEGYSE
jgi:hypothetical protein